MITNQFRGHSEKTPNKSPTRFGLFICGHSPSDLFAGRPSDIPVALVCLLCFRPCLHAHSLQRFPIRVPASLERPVSTPNSDSCIRRSLVLDIGQLRLNHSDASVSYPFSPLSHVVPLVPPHFSWDSPNL